MSDAKQLEINIVSPEGLLWKGDSSFAVLPALDGEVGIYPDHAPLLARLGVGETRIHTGEGVLYFALFGGFLEVVGNKVQVIVDRAESPESIDADAARKTLEGLGADARRDYHAHADDLRARLEAQTRLKVAARKQ
jgi:F-type H+-transporting ATPase subunit epsilon